MGGAGGGATNHPSSDFAFPHHLSLPVGSGRDPDDEVVFPTTPHYAWAEQLNGRGRALQLNVGAGLVQVSLRPNNDNDDDDDIADRVGGASNSEVEDGQARESPEL